MLRLRLKRMGRKKRPFYRVVVHNINQRPTGKALEELGFYDPINKQLKLNVEAAERWVSNGAQPTETVLKLIKLAEGHSNELIELPKKEKKEHIVKKQEEAAEATEAPAETPAADTAEDTPAAEEAEATA